MFKAYLAETEIVTVCNVGDGDVGAAQTKPLHTTVPLTVPAARSPWVTSGYCRVNASARAPSRESDFANHVDKYVGYTFKTDIYYLMDIFALKRYHYFYQE